MPTSIFLEINRHREAQERVPMMAKVSSVQPVGSRVAPRRAPIGFGQKHFQNTGS